MTTKFGASFWHSPFDTQYQALIPHLSEHSLPIFQFILACTKTSQPRIVNYLRGPTLYAISIITHWSIHLITHTSAFSPSRPSSRNSQSGIPIHSPQKQKIPIHAQCRRKIKAKGKTTLPNMLPCTFCPSSPTLPPPPTSATEVAVSFPQFLWFDPDKKRIPKGERKRYPATTSTPRKCKIRKRTQTATQPSQARPSIPKGKPNYPSKAKRDWALRAKMRGERNEILQSLSRNQSHQLKSPYAIHNAKHRILPPHIYSLTPCFRSRMLFIYPQTEACTPSEFLPQTPLLLPHPNVTSC
jgi:hypothetical protein